MTITFLRPKRPRLVDRIRIIPPEQAALAAVWMTPEEARKLIAEKRKGRTS